MNRVFFFVVLCAGAASADVVLEPVKLKPAKEEAAKPAAAPLDFVLVHETGEASRDSSSQETTLTVKGDKVHYAARSSGREHHGPGNEDKDVDTVLKAEDVVAVGELLASFDKMKTVSKLPKVLHETRYERFCVTRAGKERCIGHTGSRADDAPVPADEALLQRLLMLLLGTLRIDQL